MVVTTVLASVRTSLKEPKMNTSPKIRKVFQGVATRQQMFRMFDRHAQRPDRWADDASPLYAGEWFEITDAENDYMFEILPPLWTRGSIFAMREYLTGSVTSVFFTLRIDGPSAFSMAIAICPTAPPSSICAWLSSSGKVARSGRCPAKNGWSTSGAARLTTIGVTLAKDGRKETVGTAPLSSTAARTARS
ncbi:uncharacterized protein DUF1419 [Rhizobium sp. PP-F2F-G20b]|nr:uncharacterized protein DUF1419 [Rhizobium sp. PP-F2F-G20b]